MDQTQSHKALLLIAHGSSRPKANEEFIDLTKKVQQKIPAQKVAHAFLDCATPTIPDALEKLVQEGSKEIVVLPYFLAHGKHTSHDIPALVAEKQKTYPTTRFLLKPPIGDLPEMIELILKMI